jgi:hypothetical protein
MRKVSDWERNFLLPTGTGPAELSLNVPGTVLFLQHICQAVQGMSEDYSTELSWRTIFRVQDRNLQLVLVIDAYIIVCIQAYTLIKDFTLGYIRMLRCKCTIVRAMMCLQYLRKQCKVV